MGRSEDDRRSRNVAQAVLWAPSTTRSCQVNPDQTPLRRDPLENATEIVEATFQPDHCEAHFTLASADRADILSAFYLFRFLPTFEWPSGLHAPEPVWNYAEYGNVAIDRLDVTTWTEAEWRSFGNATLQDRKIIDEEMMDQAEKRLPR